MYIISKHKDYYDGVAQSMGIDKTIVFERHLIEIDDRKKFPEPFTYKGIRDWKRRNPFHDISSFKLNDEKKYKNYSLIIVGFCGKLYIAWKFMLNNPNYEHYNSESKYLTEIVYDTDIAKQYLDNSGWNNNLGDVIKDILNYNPINIFRELKSPYFIFESNKDLDSRRFNHIPIFTVNPILGEYGFYKVFDAFSAFQEIQMFISGVLGIDENEITEINDKYKLTQHGFDKWSFKKEPTKKRIK